MKEIYRARKTLVALVLVLLLAFTNARAQNGTSWAFHIGSPTGLISRVRMKAEMRIDSVHSFLLCYTRYWALAPGNMVGIEYRRYWPKPRRAENFIYGETGAAHHDYISFNSFERIPPDNYDVLALYLGAGIGQHINFGHFFIDLSAGLRATILSPGTGAPVYYITGPGAIIRIDGTLGFQFPSRTIKNEHHAKGKF